MRDIFKSEAMNENHPNWNKVIKREEELYSRGNDIRSEFERDYTRIIYSTAFRRMKHKTQVFFSPKNDHICTRMEHVILVESTSNSIANYLGLNTELTKAIAIGHDIGHSPFGHQGERILSEISMKDLGKTFWHERNGLEIVDNIELLEDLNKNERNLNLTYGVRDGIISHCGEIDEISIKPRKEYIDLNEYTKPNQFAPYTWEGCVVKIADKISYLGRDIQDAITMGILDEHLNELYDILKFDRNKIINNTIIINNLIYDLCTNSSLENGLRFSEKTYDIIKKIKEFNYKYIYLSDKQKIAHNYFELVINTIYEVLKESFKNKEKIRKLYPKVYSEFEDYLSSYWELTRNRKYKNKTMFDINNEQDYSQAIIYYISGMTDNYAISTFNKIVGV